MTYKEVKQLHPGDEVYWSDPDDGLCSRHLQIQTIDVGVDSGDNTVISITEDDESVVEVFLRELR